eukprot:gene12071-20321_t
MGLCALGLVPEVWLSNLHLILLENTLQITKYDPYYPLLPVQPEYMASPWEVHFVVVEMSREGQIGDAIGELIVVKPDHGTE